MKNLSIIVFTASLVACGGGESDPDIEIRAPGVMPVGLWKGELFTTKGDFFSDVAVLIAPNGEMRFLAENGAQDSGVLVLDGNKFSGDFKGYRDNGSYALSSTASGEYTSTSITGSSFVDGDKATTFSLSLSDQSSNGASLSTITGNYTTEDQETSIAIDVDGLISGSETDGCQYSGALAVPDTSVNVYDMVLTVSSCGLFNGEYDGLATYAKPFADSPEIGLVFLVDNGSFSVTDLIIK